MNETPLGRNKPYYEYAGDETRYVAWKMSLPFDANDGQFFWMLAAMMIFWQYVEEKIPPALLRSFSPQIQEQLIRNAVKRSRDP